MKGSAALDMHAKVFFVCFFFANSAFTLAPAHIELTKALFAE